MELCEILKKERAKRGLSLRAASAKIGISHSYLAALESGADPRTGGELLPSQDILGKICAAYSLSPEDAAKLLNFGGEDNLLVYMAKKIYALKTENPAKYRQMLNIVIGGGNL